MSIWGEIGKALNSTIKNPANFKPLDEIVDEKVSAFRQSAESGGVPIIRHIQRGVVSMSSSVTITLSGFTNSNKMIAIIQGSGRAGTYTNTEYSFAYGVSHFMSDLTTSKLTIKSHASVGSNVAYLEASYQVIEFW